MADRVTLYQATGTAPNTGSRAAKVLAVFNGGSYSIFTDRMGTGGVALNPKVKVASRQLALQQWSGQHADIVARFEKAAF